MLTLLASLDPTAPAHLLQADLRKSMKPQYANGDRPVVEMPLKGIPAASLESQLQKKARPRFDASAFLRAMLSTSILRL